MFGFFKMTDILLRTESNGRTWRTSKSTLPSPGSETWTEFGVLKERILLTVSVEFWCYMLISNTSILCIKTQIFKDSFGVKTP